MATRISQEQLNKFISPEAAMAPYERAQKDKQQRVTGEQAMEQQRADADAKLAQLIKGDEMKQDQYGRELQTAQDLRAQYGPETSVDAGSVRLGARDPLMALLRKKQIEQESLTPGQKAADQAFGKDYSEFVAGGGYAGADKSLKQLEDATKRIPDPNFIQRAAGILPKSVRDVVMPQSAAVEDEVRGAVQEVLRKTLGAQFTEKEGEAVMARAYNPRLPREENVKRVMAEAQKMRSAARQKQTAADLFEQTGSLVGLEGAGNIGRSQAPGAPPPAPPRPSAGLESMSDEDLLNMARQLGIK